MHAVTMLRRVGTIIGIAALGLAAHAGAAPTPCTAPLSLTANSDLQFGRLVVADRGGSVNLQAPSCSISVTDGVAPLSGFATSCAEFELTGSPASAGRSVQVQVQAPRTFSFAKGAGSAELVRTSLSGTGVQGGAGFFLVKLDGGGRSVLRLGASLRILRFAPGEIATPITLVANYLGCPA